MSVSLRLGRRSEADAGVAPVPDAAALLVRDAAVAFGERCLWRNVSFALERGMFAALLGPNGVGKSTLLRAIVALQPLSEGEIRVFGLPPVRGRRYVGYLPQRRSFDAALRVRGIDVVRLGLDGTRWGIPLPGIGPFITAGERAARQRVTELIRLVGAEAYAHRPIGELSGGEQQRLLLAQALARRPRLLLLDEPLDSLDIANQSAIAALIQRICRDEDVAVLMVAHDVNPIVRYLDRVIYLAPEGAASGSVEEVITSERLSALYRTPIDVLRTSDGRLVIVGAPEEGTPFAIGGHTGVHGPR